MSIHNLRYYGDPILRHKAKRIHRFDASLPRLVQDMFETMHANDGAGLAAPQIGLALRLFVVEGTDRETHTDSSYSIIFISLAFLLDDIIY